MKFEDQIDPKERGANGIPSKNEEMAEDYLVNKSISVLFLSLKYHKTYPKYIEERLSNLFNRKRQSRRILLVKMDTEDPNNVIN